MMEINDIKSGEYARVTARCTDNTIFTIEGAVAHGAFGSYVGPVLFDDNFKIIGVWKAVRPIEDGAIIIANGYENSIDQNIWFYFDGGLYASRVALLDGTGFVYQDPAPKNLSDCKYTVVWEPSSGREKA